MRIASISAYKHINWWRCCMPLWSSHEEMPDRCYTGTCSGNRWYQRPPFRFLFEFETSSRLYQDNAIHQSSSLDLMVEYNGMQHHFAFNPRSKEARRWVIILYLVSFCILHGPIRPFAVSRSGAHSVTSFIPTSDRYRSLSSIVCLHVAVR